MKKSVKCSIRDASLDDSKELAEYKRNYIYKNYGTYGPNTRKKIASYIDSSIIDQIKRYKFIIGDDKVIGYIFLTKRIQRVYCIEEIFIEKEYNTIKTLMSLIDYLDEKNTLLCAWVHRKNRKVLWAFRLAGMRTIKSDSLRCYLEIEKKRRKYEN